MPDWLALIGGDDLKDRDALEMVKRRWRTTDHTRCTAVVGRRGVKDSKGSGRGVRGITNPPKTIRGRSSLKATPQRYA